MNNQNKKESILRCWKQFKWIFWILFSLKLISKVGIEAIVTEHTIDISILPIFSVMQLVAVMGMVIAMGYYAYKLSGKKVYILTGLGGLIWVAVIGIFLGFFVVKTLKDKLIEKDDLNDNEVMISEKSSVKNNYQPVLKNNFILAIISGIFLLVVLLVGLYSYNKQKIATCVIDAKNKGILNEGSIADRIIQKHKGGNDDITKYQKFCENLYNLW